MMRATPCTMRWIALAVIGWQAVSLQAAAQSSPASLAGTYAASPATYSATVTAWGEDCGPKPRTYTETERPRVVVSSVGSHLSLEYPDRRIRSDQCWSPNKAVAVTSAASTASRWLSECRTPLNESKKESGRYVIQAKGPYTLELTELSTYDWQLKNSRCQATIRMIQTLERSAAERDPGSCTVQTATRIRLRPGEAVLQPGQRACFSVIESDANGCSQPRTEGVQWELEEPVGSRGSTLQDGCFRAAQSAAEAEGTFRVIAKVAAFRAQAQVRVSAADLSEITARRGALGTATSNAKGALLPAETVTATGVESATLSPGIDPRWWFAIGAGLLGSLATLTWLATRRKKRPRAEPSALAKAAPAEQAPEPNERKHTKEQPGSSAREEPMPSPLGGQLICPTCRRGFAPGAKLCSSDGAQLVAYSDFVQQHQAQLGRPSERKCPSCGTLITADSLFCGDCGARLPT